MVLEARSKNNRRLQSKSNLSVRAKVESSGFLLSASLVLITASISIIFTPAPAWSQLPPAVWGKSVHKPGDNQYVDGGSQQVMRHPTPAVLGVPAPVAQGGGAIAAGGPVGPAPWRPTPAPRTPDVSLQPIAADEPVVPAGFPPLPDRLDLPGLANVTAMSFSVQPASGGGGGGPRSGGGGPVSQGSKQGYNHFVPGSFSPQGSGPAGGGSFRNDGPGAMSAPAGGEVEMHQNYAHVAPGSFGSKSVGYYKCKETEALKKPVSANEDTFGSDAGNGPPSYSGANMAALKNLGKEPRLNDRLAEGGEGGAPEAPAPAQINQASTQDLSLPDDDFSYRKPPSKAGRFAHRAGRRIMNRAGQAINSAPIPVRMPTGR